MVAFNFQSQFADDVQYGIKRQTIRRTARCKPGDKLQLYTGQRTPQCRKLAEGVCIRVRPIRIDYDKMELDGRAVPTGDARRGEFEDCDNDFARKDGFPGFVEMAEWFHDRYGALPFEGFVIEWRLER